MLNTSLWRTSPMYLALGSCLSLVTLTASLAQAEIGNPRVNQLGYLPSSAKIATLKNTGGSQQWQLKKNGAVIASGQTTASKFDAASGDNLQQIDFSSVTATGDGFVLSVGGDSSFPFSIKKEVFNGALYDSLRYFYHNRAGIEIKTQFTGGGNGSYAANSKWSRPAGHLNAGANRGDFDVGCWNGVPCNYTLSPIKGWYDAGDHGKYVVNGGISAWTLLNMWERKQFIAPLSTNLDDGKFNIPESGNGIADILDEARWEVEFMLAMQVPNGNPKSGMAHHKLHDVGWTGIPQMPHEDSNERKLTPPTTAATLNLAAVAAQSARIWKDIDAGFASQCLASAKRAWDAAMANPRIFHDDSQGSPFQNGGGAYGDENLGDDFYWAAAELYITTGDSKYLATLNNFSSTSTEWSWQDTAFAGTVSLATVTTSHSASRQAAAKQKIISTANGHIALQNASGYSTPLESDARGYDWGSNSTVMNRMILMGLAYDFTEDSKYSDGVNKGMDYLLGRNLFSTSFATGEGTKTMTQPHHRHWAHIKNGSFPTPPPGAISGGPNARSFVGTAEGAPGGCESKPATCWKDEIGAFATNEITINWNSPFAWLLNWQKDFADETITHSSSSSSSARSSSSVASISSVPSSISSSAPSSRTSSSRSSATAPTQCNWYGETIPLCVTAQSGWSWEDNRTCVSVNTCQSQPAPYGVIGGTPSSSSATSSSAPSSQSSSSSGSTLIAHVEAENFAVMQGIQTQPTADTGGGLNVGWTDAGDWLSYSNNPIVISQSGSYIIEFRVASQNGGGRLAFEEAGGNPVYGTLNIGATGGWQNWQTLSMTVNLSAGTHHFGINAQQGGWNLNWFKVKKVN